MTTEVLTVQMALLPGVMLDVETESPMMGVVLGIGDKLGLGVAVGDGVAVGRGVGVGVGVCAGGVPGAV